MITLQIGLQIARETICAGKVLELRATESEGNALKLLRYWIMVVYLTTRLKEVYGGKVRGGGKGPGKREACCVSAEMVNVNAQNR